MPHNPYDMHFPAKASFLLCAFLLASPCAKAATNHVFATAAELAQALKAGYASTGYAKFDLTVTVTFPPKTMSRTFSAEDATGPVVLREVSTWPTPKNAPLPQLHRGDKIHAVGYIVRHDTTGTSMAEVKSFQTLSASPLPPVAAVAAECLRDPMWQDRPVRLNGVVQDAFRDEIDTYWNYLVIRSGRETVYASFTTDGSDGERLRSVVGAEIEIEGLNTSFNNGNRRMIGQALLTTGWDCVRIIKQAPEDPFAVPVLDDSYDTSAAIASGIGRRRAKGRVIAVWHGDRFLMRTLENARIVRVDLAEKAPPKYGQCVEAAGMPETDLYRLNLSRAVWRKAAEEEAATEPEAKDVTTKDLTTSMWGGKGLQTDYHGRVVRMKGVVRSMPSPNGDGRLIIECDRQTVPVDASSCLEAFKGVEIGCTISAAGICIMECENWRPNAPFPHIEGFAIVVRTPDDIRILSRPPWWTPGRLMAVIGTLLGLLAWIFVWNRMLNRRAEKRGKALAAEQVAHVTSDLKVYERTRLAVELHDSLSQNLTGVSLAIRAANRLADSDPGGMRKSLDLAAKSLDSCREELRNCLWDLRNQTLEEASMDEAIRQTLKPHIGDANLTVRFSVPREKLSDNTTHSILHIIRELASNAVRHGNATEIKVAGAIENDRLLFSVSDNGCGFNPENRPTIADGHFGLQGIQDRVEAFEGEMTLQSAPGKGTKATISIRLKSSQMSPMSHSSQTSQRSQP